MCNTLHLWGNDFNTADQKKATTTATLMKPCSVLNILEGEGLAFSLGPES